MSANVPVLDRQFLRRVPETRGAKVDKIWRTHGLIGCTLSFNKPQSVLQILIEVARREKRFTWKRKMTPSEVLESIAALVEAGYAKMVPVGLAA